MTLLPLTYLGNVQWFTRLLFEECVIDLGERYVKQSYRNRCDILSANGIIALSAQVAKPDKGATAGEARLDYSKRWQHVHWNSIVAAYRSSPWFDHYAPQLEPFYHTRCERLAEFNTGLLRIVLALLGAERELRFSSQYVVPAEDDVDMREAISPKPRLTRPDPRFAPAEYCQLFSDRHPFAPNLSIIDLLFCEGPYAMNILENSYSM
jgi:hypothetical protein